MEGRPSAPDDVLAALAATPPRQYLQRSDAGVTVLQALYQQCVGAGLASEHTSDDIARLHGLWDVALEHGLGSLVLDYVHDVCSDRLLTSSDPVEAFLLDGECVRRWCQKSVTISKGRVTSWLGRGLGFIHSSGALPKELAKLRALELVVRALLPGAQQAAADPQQPEQQQQQQQAGGLHQEAPEVEDVLRLLQCGTVLAWLGQQEAVGFERATGRYSSEQEWRGVARKRADGAAPSTLFVADTLAALQQEGIAGLQYPVPGVERLVGALFLAGATSRPAWQAKLSLLAYWLVDGGFLQPRAVAEGFRAAFHLPTQLTLSWVLRLLLDDAHAPEHTQQQQQQQQEGRAANRSISAAAALLPEVDGSGLPFKALQVFLQYGGGATALGLLRQHGGAAQRAQQADAALQEAGVAVAVLLDSGLLAEAYMEVKRHLGTLREGAQQVQHAEQLLGQLLGWGLECGSLHAIIRLPLGTVEEQVATAWLASQAPSYPQCGLILALLYLLRGRTPEALLAYAQHCPAGAGGGSEAEALQELLRQACSALPSVQRALALRQAPAPALRPAEGAEATGAVVLAGAVPGLGADGQAPLLSEGPSPQEAPLVGSVPALLALKQWQEAERDSAIAAALEPAQDMAAAAGAAAAGPTASAAAPQQRPLQQLFSFQSQQQLQQAQQAQQAAPLKGFLSGGLLGMPGPAAAGGPGRLPRFGGASSGTALDARAHTTAVGAATGVAAAGGQLPEGVVGEREFDRMLGLAAPRGGGGRPQRAGRVGRPA